MSRSSAGALTRNAASFIVAVLNFDLSELAIYEENKRAQPAIFELEEAARKKRASEDGDAGAAAKLFAGDTPEQKHAGESGTPTPAEKKTASVRCPETRSVGAPACGSQENRFQFL